MPAPNQAAIICPFIVGGAMAPVTVAGTLTQVLAEVLAGVAYSQLVRPGAPVIFGAFVTSIDMNSGAPTFGTPEAAHITYGAGQLARRLGLPYRSGGAFCGSKLPDAQAAYETREQPEHGAAGRRQLHAARLRLARGRAGVLLREVRDGRRPAWAPCTIWPRASSWTRTARRWTRSARSAPAGTTSGCDHTQANFKIAFWRSDLFDYKPFETWDEEGARDTEDAGRRAGDQDAGRLPGPGAGRGHRRGAARLCGAQEGRDAGRVHLRLEPSRGQGRAQSCPALPPACQTAVSRGSKRASAMQRDQQFDMPCQAVGDIARTADRFHPVLFRQQPRTDTSGESGPADPISRLRSRSRR